MDLPVQGEFRAYMIDYIRQHFCGLLGEHTALLDQEDGLERLATLVNSGALAEALSSRRCAT